MTFDPFLTRVQWSADLRGVTQAIFHDDRGELTFGDIDQVDPDRVLDVVHPFGVEEAA